MGKSGILVSLVCVFLITIFTVEALPGFMIIEGNLEIDNSSAPIGTLVHFYVYNEEVANFSVNTLGEYGPVLINKNSSFIGVPISISVNEFNIETDLHFLNPGYANFNISLITDADGDGFNFNIDCNDNNASINSNASETCNGLDDNCNSVVDEDLVRLIGTDVGVCEYGVEVCQSGNWTIDLNPILPTNETCNDLDDNCDSVVDEDLVRAIGTDIGECSLGAEVCNNGNWIESIAPINPQDEICDGKDDDCDSLIDEDFSNLGTSCTVGIGVCENTGSYVCASNGLNTVCSASPFSSSTEICNNLDDNCDGSIDEDLVRLIGTEVGVCEYGVEVCQSGNWAIDLNPILPTNETCNDLDDNCDSVVDDGGNSLCDDGLYCTVGEVCGGFSGCLTGASRDCSSNNLPGINSCNYDSNQFTLDYSPEFISACDEGLDKCSEGSLNLISICSVNICGAGCSYNHDCGDTNCGSLDGCYGGAYRDYSNVGNACLTSCSCSSNPCNNYTTTITDNDGDGYDVECDNDKNDNNANIHPNANEICEGVDNNQDGNVDEGCYSCAPRDYCSGWSNTGFLGERCGRQDCNNGCGKVWTNTKECSSDPISCGNCWESNSCANSEVFAGYISRENYRGWGLRCCPNANYLPRCSTGVLNQLILTCGDNICDASENCNSCEKDCGRCKPKLGTWCNSNCIAANSCDSYYPNSCGQGWTVSSEWGNFRFSTMCCKTPPPGVECGVCRTRCTSDNDCGAGKACQDGGCVSTDLCLGVTCNDYCDGNTRYYSGLCSESKCSYLNENCAYGCESNVCKNAPEPDVCNEYCEPWSDGTCGTRTCHKCDPKGEITETNKCGSGLVISEPTAGTRECKKRETCEWSNTKEQCGELKCTNGCGMLNIKERKDCPIEGDFNNDRCVNEDDLNLLKLNFGGSSMMFDLNKDKKVNFDDFFMLLDMFGGECN